MQHSDYIMVAALDLGTTCSGYALSFKSQFETKPLEIRCNPIRSNGHVLSFKTPTCVLLDENKEFKAIGYDAENEMFNMCGKSH